MMHAQVFMAQVEVPPVKPLHRLKTEFSGRWFQCATVSIAEVALELYSLEIKFLCDSTLFLWQYCGNIMTIAL